MSNLDFESRYDRLRYDLPSLGAFKPSVSYGIKGNSDVVEVGVRANFDLGGKLTTALGYSNKDVGAATGSAVTTGASASWLHDSGLNLTGAYSVLSDDDSANPDASFTTYKVGYKMEKHAISLRYAKTEDRAVEGDKSTTIGLGYVFTPNKWFNVYAGFDNNSLNRSGSNFNDIDIATVGTRFKF